MKKMQNIVKLILLRRRIKETVQEVQKIQIIMERAKATLKKNIPDRIMADNDVQTTIAAFDHAEKNYIEALKEINGEMENFESVLSSLNKATQFLLALCPY